MSDCLNNPRHEAFAQALAKGLSADAAYAEAGYRPNRGNAIRLKANERVRQRVAELVDEGAERAKVDITRVLAELGRVAFGGMGDFLTISLSGAPIIDLTRCSPDVLNTLALLEAEIIENGADGVPSIRRISIRRLDKLRALAALAKHLGPVKGTAKCGRLAELGWLHDGKLPSS